jgi:hypothetical protein
MWSGPEAVIPVSALQLELPMADVYAGMETEFSVFLLAIRSRPQNASGHEIRGCAYIRRHSQDCVVGTAGTFLRVPALKVEVRANPAFARTAEPTSASQQKNRRDAHHAQIRHFQI